MHLHLVVCDWSAFIVFIIIVGLCSKSTTFFFSTRIKNRNFSPYLTIPCLNWRQIVWDVNCNLKGGDYKRPEENFVYTHKWPNPKSLIRHLLCLIAHSFNMVILSVNITTKSASYPLIKSMNSIISYLFCICCLNN